MAEFAAVAVQALHKMSGQIRVAKIAKPVAFIGDSDSNVIRNPELGPDSDKKVSGKTVSSTHTWFVRFGSFGIASC